MTLRHQRRPVSNLNYCNSVSPGGRLFFFDRTGCSRISDSAFSPCDIAFGDIQMHNLTTLKVGGCPQLTRKGIERIINVFPHLEMIDVSSCRRLGNDAIALLLASYSSLRLLKASHLPTVDDGAFGEDGNDHAVMQSCGGTCSPFGSSITHLYLDSCSITDRTLYALSRSALSIEHLSVRWCSNLTLGGVQRFLMVSPSLQSVDISDLGFSTDSFSFFAGRLINPSWLNS